MEIDYNKWNNYTIGKVPWINKRRDHISRKVFVDFIVNSKVKNILEIGAGEAVEAQIIRNLKPEIDYTILDVSDTFLKNVIKMGFIGLKGEMHDTGCDDKEFDIVYMSSVLEHSPDLNETFKELSRIAYNFYFTMFKWKFKGGGIKSNYIENRKYYSSKFNINQLLKLLEKYGDIKKTMICTEQGVVSRYQKYLKKVKHLDFHRNGNYLSIVGSFNGHK